MELERYAILNDIHFPFEDRARYAVTLKIMRATKLNHIYLNGDIGEFQGASSWPKHPDESFKLCDEVDYINKKFDEIMKLFPGVPVTLIEGNHCYRFFRYIRDVAPQMWGLIDCPKILKFPERPKWKFVPYGPMQLVKCGISNLYLRHEPLGRGVACAKQTAENSYVDIAFGHTHTYQSYTHRKFGPSPIVTKAYSLGWMGDETRPVFDYRGAKENWVKGMTIVEATKDGSYTLDFINMRTLPILYRGKQYSAV